MSNPYDRYETQRPLADAPPLRVPVDAYPSLPRLNEKQLAARWGVSVRTLQTARVKGTGAPFIRIGRSVRYRLEDVLAYERDRLRISTSEKP